MNKEKILLTGASGLVGKRLVPLLEHQYELLTPSHKEFDLLKYQDIREYIQQHHPSIIIHGAAFTDGTGAEKERGNKEGLAWKINAESTGSLFEIAKKEGVFVIYLSTGSVFAGDVGPFSEDAPYSPEEKLSWYGYTKAVGEGYIKEGAIVRLSHPIGGSIFEKKDYLEQLVDRYKAGTLYPLFIDQPFPLTWIPDLAVALTQIIKERQIGIFHTVSSDETTPYDLMKYVLEEQKKDPSVLVSTTFSTFIKDQQLPLRFSQFSNLVAKTTYTILQIPQRSWKEIVDRSLLQ